MARTTESRREVARKLWDDPEYRAKQRPLSKARRSEIAKKTWTPERRLKHAAKIKASWALSRDKHIAGIKEAWQEPEVRERYVAGQIRKWAVRKAKKEQQAQA